PRRGRARWPAPTGRTAAPPRRGRPRPGRWSGARRRPPQRPPPRRPAPPGRPGDGARGAPAAPPGRCVAPSANRRQSHVMAVVLLAIPRRAPYDPGREFGPTGAYERLDGIARFAVDPAAPANASITDLRLAPVDGGGLVRFEADFCVLRPADPSRG